jgi:anti-sigma factor RsiW
MRDGRHPDNRLSAFLDDELDESEGLDVARHLAECADCHGELEQLRRTRDALRRLPDVKPPTMLLDEVPDAAERRGRRSHRVAVVAVCTSLGVSGLLAAAFVVGGQEGDVVMPPVEVFVVDHVVRTGGGPVLSPVSFEQP